MAKKSYVVGCDNAAVELKKELLTVLDEMGLEYEDVGVNEPADETMYPSVAEEVCRRIIDSGYTKEGILVCGTGIGMAITANKFPGIYAAVCHDNYAAERARLSNNTNVICMGARIIGPELAKKVLREWLSAEFKGGRSTPKVNKIKEIEGGLYRGA
ncbi:ribose 5-phosphate isomerase B [Candidatus Darwinibacter acetoxidans]|jgi:ribose 5-phosphate isomerase B|nr:ribose 5-phosphate isomerase B [Bacillota bacterium]